MLKPRTVLAAATRLRIVPLGAEPEKFVFGALKGRVGASAIAKAAQPVADAGDIVFRQAAASMRQQTNPRKADGFAVAG